LNIIGSKAVGEAEEWIVALKIAILLVFVAVGLFSTNPAAMEPAQWSGTVQLVAGGMLIFLAYEGFELIANTAQDVRDADRTLPRAYYSAVVFVIALYVLVSVVTVGNLSVGKIVQAKDYALAEAAKPFMGETGFILIGIAAMLSTASAINATLYGAARISYIIAKDGELPRYLDRKVWSKPIEGLLITAGLTLLVANLFKLESISLMGSAGFLIVFAAVNAANTVRHKETASKPLISAMGALACLAALGALIRQSARDRPSALWVLGAMVLASIVIEATYRGVSGRRRKRHLPTR
jgi:amino acid transporter